MNSSRISVRKIRRVHRIHGWRFGYTWLFIFQFCIFHVKNYRLRLFHHACIACSIACLIAIVTKSSSII